MEKVMENHGIFCNLESTNLVFRDAEAHLSKSKLSRADYIKPG